MLVLLLASIGILTPSAFFLGRHFTKPCKWCGLTRGKRKK